ncbi:MAG: hypothetical protein Fur0044_51710 [Anaerolineae bacterium]
MDFMIPILMIAGIHLAAVASPGPNFFYQRQTRSFTFDRQRPH